MESATAHDAGRVRTLRRSRTAGATLLRLAPLVAFVAVLFALLAPWGANTMDGGLILAQSYRILHGQIPHLDFLTPRPAGSAYLHLLDFALPLPLVLSSRLVAICEFTAYALLFSALVFRRRLSEFGPAEVAGVVCATLVSIQTFLLIPFYTIDALVLLGAGWLLIVRARSVDSGAMRFGFVCLGVAATTKQSFWFGPFLALVGVAWAYRASGRRLVSEGARLLACSLAPGAAYAFWVVVHGGLHDMLAQLFGAQAVTGSSLFDAFTVEPGVTLSLLAVLAIVLVAIELRRSLAAVPLAGPILRVAGTVLVAWAALRRGFGDEQWSRQLFWAAVLVLVLRAARERRIDPPGAVLVVTAWMVSLSWGAPTPALIAGPLALYVLDALWRGADADWPAALSPPVLSLVGAAVAVGVVGAVFWSARISDRAAGQDVSLGSIDSTLRGIHAGAATATLFRDARDCSKRYPARFTAVVGEGALLSPTLGFRSPFPIDWFWKDDYRGHEQWILDKTSAFDARGHYLVLFQTAPQGLERTAVHGRIGAFFSDPGMAQSLAERLHGTRHACGSLVAVYRPNA
jgi:hypothetical protein